MLNPQRRAWQKWQRMGCLTSSRASVNKHILYGPPLLSQHSQLSYDKARVQAFLTTSIYVEAVLSAVLLLFLSYVFIPKKIFKIFCLVFHLKIFFDVG